MVRIRHLCKRIATIGSAAVMACGLNILLLTPSVHAAACAASTNGTVTMSVAIPATATYRVWSRMMAPDTTHNNYYLEVDGTNCYLVGDNNTMPANTWTWVNYRDGNTANRLDLSLTQGSHSLKLIGNDAGVKLDRVVFASDLNCVPSGDGTNCDIPPDTTPPTVTLTAPAANSTVKGVVTLQASSSDNSGGSGISKVEFYVNSSLKGTDTTAPYAATWDTATAMNGSQLVMAKAYDGAGNVSLSSYTVNVQNGTPAPAPTPPSDVVATPAPGGTGVVVTWKPSATPPSSYVVTRNGLPIAQVGGGATTYKDTTAASNTDYSYQVKVVDNNGNVSDPSGSGDVTTPKVADSVPPSAPTELSALVVSASQINLSWKPSTDNVGVKGYEIYRALGKGSAQKIAFVLTGTTFGDTGLQAGAEFSYYVKAVDGSGNASKASSTVSAKTNATKRKGVIRGTVHDAAGRPISKALVVLTLQNTKYFYKTGADGRYVFRGLPAARYSITYQAAGYANQSVSVKLGEDVARYNITLMKK